MRCRTCWCAKRSVVRSPDHHYVPTAEGFGAAVRAGLGWGMFPEQLPHRRWPTARSSGSPMCTSMCRCSGSAGSWKPVVRPSLTPWSRPPLVCVGTGISWHPTRSDILRRWSFRGRQQAAPPVPARHDARGGWRRVARCAHLRHELDLRRVGLPRRGGVPLRGAVPAFDRSVNVNSSATELPTLTGTRSAHQSRGLPCALPLVQADETAARGDLAFEEALSPDLLADLRRGRPAISEPELGDR